MLVLNRGQRELLADKLLDAANLAVAALFFGQFVGDSVLVAVGTTWGRGMVLALWSSHHAYRPEDAMMTFVVLYGSIAFFASVLILLDYFGRRQQRKAQRTAGGSSPSPHVNDFWP